MHSFSALSALALAVTTVNAIPPESFGFPSAPNDTQLVVAYNYNGNTTSVEEAELFGVGIPSTMPTVAVNEARYRSLASYTGSYVVMMVDPDASTPQNPSERFILHWLAPNMTAASMTATNVTGNILTNSTPAFVPYAQPMPPPTSDPHRYIQYAFFQPDNFSIPPAFSGYSAMNRTSFNLTEFISAASLGSPAAANYFFCSNKSSVPADFIAMAGGTFPGGNGAAVTAGLGPAASSTASGSASMTTGASSATSSAAGGAASVTSAAASATSMAAAAGNAGSVVAPGVAVGWVAAALGMVAFYFI